MRSPLVEPPNQPSAWQGLTRLVEGPLGCFVTLILTASLLAAVLLLPPVNLLENLDAFTYTRIGVTGGAISDSDGTTLNFPGEGVQSAFGAKVESLPRVDFIQGKGGRQLNEAALNLPTFLVPKSPLYSASVRGNEPEEVVVTIPIPNDSLPYETLAVYMWNGEIWQHMPRAVFAVNDMLESRLNFVPEHFMVVQTVPAIPEVAASIEFGQQLPEGARVAAEMVSGLLLRGDGALDGNAPVNNQRTMPIIRNWTGDSTAPSVRTDLVNNMLIEVGQQENQLNAVEQTLIANGYSGVVIDYRGIDAIPSAKADFVYLISELADRLHVLGETLAVRAEAPVQISAESWDTKGHDWRALGAVVDTFIIPAPIDPRAYQANGEMEILLNFAVSEVDRRKIQIELPVQSVERSGNYLLLKGYQQALQPILREIQSENGGSGDILLTLDNERLLSKVTWDESLGMYVYRYQDDQSLERTVYIESAGSLAKKLQILEKFNIRKVALSLPTTGDIDRNIWDTVLQFQEGGNFSANMSRLEVAYAIYDSEGSVVAQQTRPIEEPGFILSMPSGGGNYQIDATIINGNQAIARSQANAIAAVASIVGAERQAESAAESTESAQLAAAVPQSPSLTTTTIVNVREGPSTAHNILGQVVQGSTYPVMAKNEVGDWWLIEYAEGQTGWVIGSLTNTQGDMASIAATSDYPEPPVVQAPVVQPAAAPDPGGQPAPAPIVSAPAPTGGGPGFGYGVQAHMVHNNQEGQVMQMTTNMGFNWVKQQIEWKVFESNPGGIDFGSSDGIVNAANNSGVSLLFSVVNAPPWAREPGFDGSVGGPPQDPNTYANFVGAMAGKYCGSSLKAIEVWNEQNLHYEWGNKPLNPGEYVALLIPSYAAIKAACPSMTVVSGALTPAGNNGNLAMDDFTYLEAMFQAGMANYADAIGAHPSGYNVPPDHTWETACDAIQVSGNSFNGACDSPHHSWSFRSTMEGYRNIANVYGASHMRIWPTEFGWAAGGAFNPNYAYANDNDFNEQAEWTVRAFQMMRDWGWVGPAFLWNLNFRVVADGTEKAQWGIVDNGWRPLPIYNALQGMPK
ncbi:SH3 domain-containing protein [Chloroflexi bacterium TSY]|nr:SH3 domain-containing protein [Chloroflexi bacterium TSY]